MYEPNPTSISESRSSMRNRKLATGAIAGIVIVAASVLAITMLVLLLRRRRHRQSHSWQTLQPGSSGSSFIQPPPRSPTPLLIDPTIDPTIDLAPASVIDPHPSISAPLPPRSMASSSERRQQLEHELRIVQGMVSEIQKPERRPLNPTQQQQPRRFLGLITVPDHSRSHSRTSEDLASELQLSRERNDMLAMRIRDLEDQLGSLGESAEPPTGYSA
ncbi:hypothetical protein K438DRAFT_108442 [Mycena galopus ATCC 62051]|nr:hypothetical protein K438DRAFT_108442 [Mycena galopus ATCC 62051]